MGVEKRLISPALFNVISWNEVQYRLPGNSLFLIIPLPVPAKKDFFPFEWAFIEKLKVFLVRSGHL